MTNRSEKHIFLWDDTAEEDILPPEQEATAEDIDALQALQDDPNQALYERLMACELATA